MIICCIFVYNLDDILLDTYINVIVFDFIDYSYPYVNCNFIISIDFEVIFYLMLTYCAIGNIVY